MVGLHTRGVIRHTWKCALLELVNEETKQSISRLLRVMLFCGLFRNLIYKTAVIRVLDQAEVSASSGICGVISVPKPSKATRT